MSRAFTTWVCLVALLAACPSFAEEPPPDPSVGESYDGRSHPHDWRRDLLWVPRLVLLPLRAVFMGLGYVSHHLLDWDERNHVYATIMAALSSSDGQRGVRPTFDYAISFAPSVGLRYFDRKLLGAGTDFEAMAMAGSLNIVHADVYVRPTRPDQAFQADFKAAYNRRNDQVFTGIGYATDSESLIEPPSRYAVDAFDTAGELTLAATPGLFFGGNAGFGVRRFHDGIRIATDPPITEVYCVRNLAGMCIPGSVDETRVPGFAQGTQFFRTGVSARVDSRDNWYRPSSGALLEASLDYTHGLGFDTSQYLRASAALSGVLDLWQRSRVLVLKIWAQVLEPLDNSVVPFSELIVLGGPDDFRGFRPGRFRNYSSLLAAAEYRWPIWMWMDASIFAEYGGAFGRGFEGFSLSRMVPDVGAGFRLRSSDAFYVRAQAAYGWGDGWQFFLSVNTGL